MGTLRTELERIASSFVSSVLDAMRSASLSDLADNTGGGRASGAAVGVGRTRGRPRGRAALAPPASARRGATGRRRRRASPEEVARQKDVALAASKGLKPGFSKGDVMSKSGSKVDLGRALSLLVADGKLTKKGDRRMTRYWVK
jgi:hypothetical protein